jgi:DNA-directed RNA polymerase subunit N (RpoN/RPB10)
MPPQASLEGSQVALPALEPFRRLDQQQRAHILAQKMPIVWQQSDNVPFEQSRNVLLTTPAWGNVCWVKANYALGEFRLRLWGWKAERRFVVLRERVRESRHSVGRKLIDVPGYAFRVFVTSQTQAAEEVWRDYNRRADMENRIGELKHDLGADGFCMQKFFATEAAFRTVLLVFNLLAEFQRAAGLPGYREPATLRTQVLTCGAILGRAGRRLVLHLSESWGGLKTRTALLDNILHWKIPTSPELAPGIAT